MREEENTGGRNQEMFQASHLFLLVSYTIISVVLIFEAVMLSWEIWALPLVALGVGLSWYLHISGKIPEYYRLWIYTTFILMTFFYYGIHWTSFYDLAPVISYFILLFSVTGVERFVTVCQIVYYLVMLYDIVAMLRAGETFDFLNISRILLHMLMIFMIGYVSKLIIRRRRSVYLKLDQEITGLRSITQSMDRFLTTVSHEIRTPINVVIGLTTMVLKREENEESRKDLNSILSAGYRAAGQIDDVLDYTELDLDRLGVANEVYMIASLINDLVTELKMQQNIVHELIFDVDAETPAAFIGDSEKIRKILRHLITNGMKFTKKGGVYARIYTMERDYGVNLCIEITDTGIGMKEEEIDRIFEQFYQTDTARGRAAGGFGIGMTIVHGLVQSMGGFIHIDSELNVGTSVIVSIPQKVADPSRCMYLSDRNSIRVGGYLRFSRAEVPRVREFYNSMVSHMEKGLGITIHRAENISDLNRLMLTWDLTHIIVGDTEYLQETEAIEELAKRTVVIVVAEDSFQVREDSAVRILRKPFYCFPIVSLLDETQKKEPRTADLDIRRYLSGAEILVVDDEPMNLLVARGIFGEYGMRVETATNGPEAIRLCRKKRYDIIFMDHMMPDMDGVEAMKLIRSDAGKRDEDLIIIALTANAVSSAKEMFLQEGFDGFIPKPIELPVLERVLVKAIKRLPRQQKHS
ncbi:MAG: response regulator [Lachnospiraceae bacterium]|nr:response regulator [Lachnospiraceae bacterium]